MSATHATTPEEQATIGFHKEVMPGFLDGVERLYGTKARIALFQTVDQLHAAFVRNELDKLLQLPCFASPPFFSDGPKLSSIECSEDGTWIRINGKEYIFTGVRQCGLILCLYKSLKKGHARMPTKHTLASVGFSSNINTIPKAFAGSKKPWQEVVGYSGGFCWLKA